MEGVSFVVPVHNGAGCIRETLDAIRAQDDGRPMEIIVVDDRSGDESAAILRQMAQRWPLRLLTGEGRGAAAAINEGVRAARFPIVCQVDQDVVIGPGWMRRTEVADDGVLGVAPTTCVRDAPVQSALPLPGLPVPETQTCASTRSPRSINSTGLWKVQFLLYRDSNLNSVYRELHLFVQVS